MTSVNVISMLSYCHVNCGKGSFSENADTTTLKRSIVDLLALDTRPAEYISVLLCGVVFGRLDVNGKLLENG